MTSTEKNEQLIFRMMEMYKAEYIVDETTRDDALFLIHVHRTDADTQKASIVKSGNNRTLVKGLFSYGVENTDFAKVIGLTFLELSPVMTSMQEMADMATERTEDPGDCDCPACRFNRGEL